MHRQRTTPLARHTPPPLGPLRLAPRKIPPKHLCQLGCAAPPPTKRSLRSPNRGYGFCCRSMLATPPTRWTECHRLVPVLAQGGQTQTPPDAPSLRRRPGRRNQARSQRTGACCFVWPPWAQARQLGPLLGPPGSNSLDSGPPPPPTADTFRRPSRIGLEPQGRKATMPSHTSPTTEPPRPDKAEPPRPDNEWPSIRPICPRTLRPEGGSAADQIQKRI